MSENLTFPSVLRVNSSELRLGWSTPQDALKAMMGGKDGSAPYLGVDVDYALKENGEPDYDQCIMRRRVAWDEWLTLPIRPWDKFVSTTKQKIRIPAVVVCPNYGKMPKKQQKPTPANIRRRDGNKCQYTGVPLDKSNFSLDHINPQSKGGQDTWENLVSCHKDVNSKKGNKSNKEAGLALLKKPIAPLSIPLCAIHTEIKHPDHTMF